MNRAGRKDDRRNHAGCSIDHPSFYADQLLVTVIPTVPTNTMGLSYVITPWTTAHARKVMTAEELAFVLVRVLPFLKLLVENTGMIVRAALPLALF
jgi:hypothetical protein